MDDVTSLEAAQMILQEAGEPLGATELTRRAIERGWLITGGPTPEATMRAQLGTALKRLGEAAEIVRFRRGVWGLRKWQQPGRPDPAGHPHQVPERTDRRPLDRVAQAGAE